MIIISNGIPVEFTFTTARTYDLEGFKQLPVNLPEGSEILADSAYTDYQLEEMLLENQIQLLAARKSNSKRPHNPGCEYLIYS
ncbi:MAG: hypothetical protein LUH22_06875 [Bacteroides sp.]|nr:hypothetical protein [Bacteroides sp.]